MGTGIERLKELQAVDAEIRRAEILLHRGPERLADVTRELKAAKDREAAHKLAIREAQKEVDRKELDLRSREAEIGKLNVQLNTIKTNKEYSLIKLKMEGLKADNSLLEEEILEAIGKVDALRADTARFEAELKAIEAERLRTSAEVEKEMSVVRGKLAVLQETRREIATGVRADILEKYDRIRRGKEDGQALAAVRDQTCQGCNMSVTTHELTLIMKSTDLVLCRSCSRVLYLE
jgi:predicted  nucleic acid-binding Zn-ribbon protein